MPAARTGKILPHDGLTFDDVFLLPRYVDFPREQADITTVLCKGIRLRLPVLSSPMDKVTETDMAVAMAQKGGLGIIHRNLKIDAQAAMVRAAKDTPVLDRALASLDARGCLQVAAAVGAGPDMAERVATLIAAGADMIVVDSGHGHAGYIIDCVKHIKKHHKGTPVMAGNVATYEGAKALIKAGTDVLRVGMGCGSICTTRIITGMGVPQVTALLEVARATKGTKATFVADGGIRQMGDIAKAIATGAGAVILGSMLAGFEQSPGEMVDVDGKMYKSYRGMGSVSAMQKGGAERYGQSMKTESKKLIAEGVEGLVPFKGDVQDFLFQIAGSLRSAFYYLGSSVLKDFQKHAQFIRVTNAGLKESHPHSIAITNAGGNYLS